MAYLNVRERRIEAKIAYVGPDLAGKATNLHHLKKEVVRGRATDLFHERSVSGGELLSLEWTPLQMPRFNDCDIAVKVVAARGALSAERLDDVLADVDGVVVVVEAAAAARDESRRAIGLVREALLRDGAAPRPVVVQVNKTDLEDAVQTRDLATTLEINDWPLVPASATRGDGVVETLERALGSVLETMKAEGPDAPEVRADHNPLLDALRQILRETVAEHMAGLERETTSRMTAAVTAAIGDSRAHDELLARFDGSERAIAELWRAFSTLHADVTKLVSAVHEVSERMSAVHASSLELPNKRDLVASEARVRDELGARSRGDREHLTSALAVVRRAVDGTSAELRKLDVRDELAAAARQIEELSVQVSERADATSTLPAQIKALETKLGALDTNLHRELHDAGAKLESLSESVQLLHVDAGSSFARVDARASELKTGLEELLDDFRKRKKGWFS